MDSEDDVWVASAGARVQEFSEEGAFMQAWIVPGVGAAVTGIAIDPEGKVWVVGLGSFATPKVRKLTSAGEVILEFGAAGSGNGQFASASDIAADSEGNVLVADTGNQRIQEFNSAGEFVRKYGSEGTGNGQFKSPRGVAVDPEGRVWVADTGNNRIQRFSAKGAYQAQLGSTGPNGGQFEGPQGIAVDSEENVWVADTGNDRVQESSCE